MVRKRQQQERVSADDVCMYTHTGNDAAIDSACAPAAAGGREARGNSRGAVEGYKWRSMEEDSPPLLREGNAREGGGMRELEE